MMIVAVLQSMELYTSPLGQESIVGYWISLENHQIYECTQVLEMESQSLSKLGEV